MRAMEDIRANAKIAADFKPMTEKQVAALEQRFANDPDSERFAHYSCPGYRDGGPHRSDDQLA
jgi:hypothetical protein